MKTVRVAAAVICDSLENKTKIFAAARGYGEFKGRWEFPGGKLEPGETSEQALVREIREELGAKIVVGELIDRVEYDYPFFHLSMDCFWCAADPASLDPKEAADVRWLTKDELFGVDWLDADLELVAKIADKMGEPPADSGITLKAHYHTVIVGA